MVDEAQEFVHEAGAVCCALLAHGQTSRLRDVAYHAQHKAGASGHLLLWRIRGVDEAKGREVDGELQLVSV